MENNEKKDVMQDMTQTEQAQPAPETQKEEKTKKKPTRLAGGSSFSGVTFVYYSERHALICQPNSRQLYLNFAVPNFYILSIFFSKCFWVPVFNNIKINLHNGFKIIVFVKLS